MLAVTKARPAGAEGGSQRRRAAATAGALTSVAGATPAATPAAGATPAAMTPAPSAGAAGGAAALTSSASAAALSQAPSNPDAPPLFAQHYSSSAACAENLARVAAASMPTAALALAAPAPAHTRPSFALQFSYVLHRNFNELSRSPTILPIRLVGTLALALLAGIVWINQNLSVYSGLQAAIGFCAVGPLFFCVIMYATSNQWLMNMRAIFYREQAARTYSHEAYSLTLLLVEAPWLLLYAAIFVLIDYWMVGLAKDAGFFFMFFLGVWTLALYYVCLGHFFSGLAPNLTINALLTALSFGLLQLFCGLFIR